ncbi:alkaline phosphatase family protein [Dongia sedimenti]|uniref:Alkaline phosphatase family protein n=1 Tax=Dongia sedimenti TaxID=3064282 RepID=A0ABU0YNT6_9PROT|nr:alkaline phosphatase family protein [Rhodospirillaceae bacterium R-7]
MDTLSRIMPQIEHVVLLMLENRSLDNVTGWIYENGKPQRLVPAKSSPDFDGLIKKTFFNSYDGKDLYVAHGTQDFSEPMRVPRYDPHEPFAHVTIQLFGDSGGNVPIPLKPGTPAKMKGFAYDYDASYEDWSTLHEVMGAYRATQLSVLGNLALDYAISDRWFSSVPTQTNPNRAFTVCGTSLGRVKNSNEQAIEQFDTKTIWNALPTGTSWGLYYQDVWQNNQCFTHYTFPWIDRAVIPGRFAEIAKLDTFLERAKAGTLPAFTFLEPSWGYGKGIPGDGWVGKQGNDYHPPTEVGPGEEFVAEVYQALTKNVPAWQKTLLIVTFDEHGGTYDHADPGWGAKKPDSHSGPAPDNFQFDRFGVRVPTIMASPWIPAGTVFRSPSASYPYDHTSFISTILRWQGIDPVSAGLGQRVMVAPTFESVLSDKMRTDIPDIGTIADTIAGPAPVPNFAGAEGVPVAVMRMIVDTSVTIEEVEARLKLYKARGGLPV